MAVIGAIFGSLPGGAAILCLAHDCLLEDSGETEGFVRTDILLSAVSSFVTLRRSMRAAAVGSNGPPESVDGQDKPVEVEGAAAPVAEGSDEGDGSRVGLGSGRCGNPCPAAMTIAAASAVAEAEVATELDIYGNELCADLAEIFTTSSSHSAADGGSGASGCVSTPQFQHDAKSSKTRRIRWAVKKQSAVLSPQSVCALTALLSAKGEEWANHSHSQNSDKPTGDSNFWKTELLDALLAVRTASLEHLTLWVDACDPGKLDAACVAEVLMAEGATPAPSGVGNRQMKAGTAGAPVVTAEGVGGDKKVAAAAGGGGGGGEEATWAVLHKASGLGLSPLMALATTLYDSDDHHCCSGGASLPVSLPFYGAGGVVDGETGSADQNSVDLSSIGGGHGGGGSADSSSSSSRDCSTVVALTKSAMLSALRLLSSTSLQNVARHLLPSQHPRRANSTSFQSDKLEILSDIPGHPAIGDLSCLDEDTLRRGAEGVVMALDARGTGALPPAVLAVALQSGEAGLRLEPFQAQVVLRLAGGFC